MVATGFGRFHMESPIMNFFVLGNSFTHQDKFVAFHATVA
jgi:hypothetical protein